jgi:hypothetical protein
MLRAELQQSSVLVVVGSANAFDGDWVRWELEAFEEGHWGRMVPLITRDTSAENQTLMRGLRRVHSAIVYEEGERAWEDQKVSAVTVLCLALAREFFRVELEFWQRCASIAPEKRVEVYYQTLAQNQICRALTVAMTFPERDVALQQMQAWGMAKARGHRDPRSFFARAKSKVIGAVLGRLLG